MILTVYFTKVFIDEGIELNCFFVSDIFPFDLSSQPCHATDTRQPLTTNVPEPTERQRT